MSPRKPDIPDLLEAIRAYPEPVIWIYPKYDPIGYPWFRGAELDLRTLQVLNFELFGFSLSLSKSKQCWMTMARRASKWESNNVRDRWWPVNRSKQKVWFPDAQSELDHIAEHFSEDSE